MGARCRMLSFRESLSPINRMFISNFNFLTEVCMFGDKFNLGAIMGLLKNPGKIQSMMKEAQEKLAKVEVTGESGAGLVKIVVTAENYAKSVFIDDSVLQEDKTVLQD